MRLLDTDVLSSLVRQRVPDGVRAGLEGAAVLYTSAVNLAEVRYGIEKAGSQRLSELYEVHVFPFVVVLPFDDAAAEQYGRVRAELEARGTPLGETDLMIASVALAHRLTLVTGNEAHFRRVPGLVIENWLA